MPSFTVTKDYREEECCSCGIIWFTTRAFLHAKEETKGTFYCPNGHAQSYKESISEGLTRRIREKDEQILALQKELITKTKKKK